MNAEYSSIVKKYALSYTHEEPLREYLDKVLNNLTDTEQCIIFYEHEHDKIIHFLHDIVEMMPYDKNNSQSKQAVL